MITATENEIAAGLRVLVEAGSVVELRVPKAGRSKTISGYFDDLDKMARAAARLSGHHPGIYFTANPVNPALLARCNNRTIEYAELTTGDHDIARRRWLPIDLDPVRPSGIPSTDAEHEVALERARIVRRYLVQDLGWPEPVAADSGNGAYVLCRIDLPNDDTSRDLVNRCLDALAILFDDEAIKVDGTMFNAARIIRIPGTRNAKGDGTDDRPLRPARLLHAPDPIEVVDVSQLHELVKILPDPGPDPKANGQRTGQSGPFDLDGFIRRNLKVHHEAPWKQGGRRWIVGCPMNSDHGEKSAYVARQPNGAIAAGCQHYSCKTWGWAELRERYEPKPDKTTRRPSQASQGPYFDQQGQLIVPKLGQEIEDAGHLAIGVDGQLYRYDRGVYRPDGETYVRTQVRTKLGRQCKRAHFGEVLTWTGARYPTVTTWPPEQWINCANGLLDWRTGNLEPHTPEVVTTVQLPVTWDPTATCPQWEKFLTRVVTTEVAQLVEEVVGYCLIPGNRFRKAILLLGPTGTGKSKALAATRALLGPANVSATTLQSFAENRFAAADLFGKLANIAGDLDARSVDRSDTFKMVTGGDPIQAERKFGQPFSFTPFAKLLFSANEPPLSTDQTDAWFARWLIIPFETQIPETEQDGDLEAKLTTPAELSGLLVRAVNGLRQLMKRGRFEEPDAVQKAAGDYRDRLDSVRGFISDECVLLIDAHIARSKLYKSYAKWCNDGGRHPLGRERFHDSIRRNWSGEVIEQTVRGTREFKGIGLKSTDSEGEKGAAPWI